MGTKLGEKNTQKITLFLVKSSFHSIILFRLTIVPLILYRATITLSLLVREKEPLILTFLNLYVTLHKINGSV